MIKRGRATGLRRKRVNPLAMQMAPTTANTRTTIHHSSPASKGEGVLPWARGKRLMNTTAKVRPPRTSQPAPRILNMRLPVSGTVRHFLVSFDHPVIWFGGCRLDVASGRHAAPVPASSLPLLPHLQDDSPLLLRYRVDGDARPFEQRDLAQRGVRLDLR